MINLPIIIHSTESNRLLSASAAYLQTALTKPSSLLRRSSDKKVGEHRCPHKFLQERAKFTSSFSSPSFPIFPFFSSLPFPHAISTLPFLLCCEANTLNTAKGLGPRPRWGNTVSSPSQWGLKRSPSRNDNLGSTYFEPVKRFLWQRFWFFLCEPNCCN